MEDKRSSTLQRLVPELQWTRAAADSDDPDAIRGSRHSYYLQCGPKRDQFSGPAQTRPFSAGKAHDGGIFREITGKVCLTDGRLKRMSKLEKIGKNE